MKPIANRAAKPRQRLELGRFLPYRLSILANTLSRGVARIYARRFDLTIPEWRVMAVLGCFGAQSANQVCARTVMDKVRVSRAVARLARMGRVKRATDPADRRHSVLTLTAKGVAVHDRIVPLARGIEQQFKAALEPRDAAAFDRLVAKLQSRAEAMLG